MEDMDLEIVGLNSSTSGRSCCIHACCSKSVAVGNVLCLLKTVVMIDGHDKEAMKYVKVVNGANACTVGFVPRVEAVLPKVGSHLNKFAIYQQLQAPEVSGQDK